MLPKSKRIPRELFKSFSSGQYFNTQHFTVKVLPKSAGKRFAVSVSKKISKKATIRNRTRRRVYSSINKLSPRIPNGLYLLVAKKDSEKLKGEVLNKELEKLLLKS